MSASEIAHNLKEFGGGDEYTGVENVFKSGIVVGIGSTLITGFAIYGIHRLVKWGHKKYHEALEEQHPHIVVITN